jgi:plasmid maintenance system killer protein
MASADPGIASLPVDPNMYTEQTMAQGGIVSFQGGGDPYFEKYQQYMRALQDPTQDPAANSSAFQRMFTDASAAKQYESAKRKELERLSFLGARDPGFFTPTTPQERAAIKARGDIINKFRLGEYDPKPTAKPKTGAPPAATTPPPAPTQGNLAQLAAADMPQQAPTAAPAGPGIRSLMPSEPRFTPIEADTAGYDALMKDPRSLGEYRKEYMDELGVDPSRAKQEERLAAMQSRAEKEESQAPWMALAEAGLGMAAGNSPFALQNIATGGMQGVKSLQAAKERAAKAEEKRFDLEAKIAESQRAEQVAALNYGADSKQAAERNKTTVGLQKEADKQRVKEFNAKGKFEDKALSAQLAMEDKKIQTNMKNIERQIAATVNSDERAALRQASTNAKARLDAAQKQMNSIRVEMTKSQYDENTIKEYARQLEDAKADYNDASAELKALASSTSSAGDALVNKYKTK